MVNYMNDNSILNALKERDNIKLTENLGIARKSTLDAVYDLWSFGGAYRKRSEADCILLFKNAFEQDESMALKCLFYLRDIRGRARRAQILPRMFQVVM